MSEKQHQKNGSRCVELTQRDGSIRKYPIAYLRNREKQGLKKELLEINGDESMDQSTKNYCALLAVLKALHIGFAQQWPDKEFGNKITVTDPSTGKLRLIREGKVKYLTSGGQLRIIYNHQTGGVDYTLDAVTAASVSKAMEEALAWSDADEAKYQEKMAKAKEAKEQHTQWESQNTSGFSLEAALHKAGL